MTSALVAPSFKNIAAGLAGLLLAVSFFFASATPAHANGLTESQVQAILSLLASFNVDQNTIANVNIVLHGGSTDGDKGRSCEAQNTCEDGDDWADIKINGSDGPLYVKDNARLTITWESSGASGCYITNVRRSSWESNTSIEGLGPNGSLIAYAHLSDGNNGIVGVQCGWTTDTVKLKLSETSSTATITNSPILTSTGAFTVSGKASNATTLIISVAPSNYSGATDWQTLGDMEKGGGIAGFHAEEATVSGGRWSKQFGDRFGAGVYTVRVFDYTSCRLYSQCSRFSLLATGKVTIAPELQSMLQVPYNSGHAPFSVTFYMQSLNPPSASGHEFYMLNFGDGEYYITQSVGKDAIEHTYNSAGTYSAKLSQCTQHMSEKDCDGWTALTSVYIFVSQGLGMAPAAPAPVAAVPATPSLPLSVADTPDALGLVAAAATAPWRAAVDVLSDILYAIGVY